MSLGYFLRETAKYLTLLNLKTAKEFDTCLLGLAQILAELINTSITMTTTYLEEV